ncbi:SAG-related sequence [Besnoitia besnoiti]|uniref:SAG-related sequence n=1 Tax=Besnoitia besnoiti TaxID=94643 RepID=A0A2A9MGW2_BESBE|nr:SAG-related sequence [Besnoitia besnoiti]PFH37768.1 SAG-related sequence [Besnoitia besnoiti]
MARTGVSLPPRRGLKSGARKLAAMCVAGTLLFCSGHVVADQQLASHQLQRLDSPAVESPSAGSVVDCEANTLTTKPEKPFNLTLSKDKPTVALQCKGDNNEVVPQDPKLVCSVQKDLKVKDCKAGVPPDQQLSLQKVLGSTSEIEAGHLTLEKGQQWKLELNESQLPRLDTSFFVGCQTKNNDHESNCKAIINVKARPSSANQDNVVTCAYGKDSNPETLKVEMTETSNTLTLDCGYGGSVKPPKYTASYCDGQDMANCTKSFTEILPRFEEKWWTKEDPGTLPAQLTIPPTDFPAEDQSFYIGCAPNASGAEKQKTGGDLPLGQQEAPSTSTCKVRVTVKAASSVSLAQPALPVAVTASGAVVFERLVTGAF